MIYVKVYIVVAKLSLSQQFINNWARKTKPRKIEIIRTTPLES